jgi:mxaK protein
MPKFQAMAWLLRALVVLCMLCAGLAAWHMFRHERAEKFNALIAAPKALSASNITGQYRDTALMLTLANQLQREGKTTEALTLLRDVEAQLQTSQDASSQALRSQAKFNSANIYLRQAISFAERGDKAKAVPPTELAKGLYREVLRSDSKHWDARYNLERALTIVPELEAADNDASMLPPPGERAVTTMRGVSPGMP